MNRRLRPEESPSIPADEIIAGFTRSDLGQKLIDLTGFSEQEVLNYVQGALQAYETGAVRDMVRDLLVSARRAAKEAGYTDEQIQQVEQRLYEAESKVNQVFEELGESESLFQEGQEEKSRAKGSLIKEEVQRWANTLDNWAKGKDENPGRPLVVGRTPEILQKLGAKDLDLYIPRDKLSRIQEKHNLPLDILKRLPELINDPLAVLDSATQADALVVVAAVEVDGKPLVIPIHLDTEKGGLTLHKVASVHKRDGGWGWVKGQILQGRLRFYSKRKAASGKLSARLQLPQAFAAYGKSKILTDKDIVKPLFQDAPSTRTDTPEFRAWFGDSKVVDENGEPLVVYHGTGADFEAFKPGADGGIHFGTQDQASMRAGRGKVIPVYLKASKLKRMKDKVIYREVWSLPLTDKMRAEILEQGLPLYQEKRFAPPRGAMVKEGGQHVIYLFERADKSTLPHEIGHVFRQVLEELALDEATPQWCKDDWAKACSFVGARVGKEWTRNQEEKWARAFEQYLFEGKVPSEELRSVFQTFRRWMLAIYHKVLGLGIKLDPEIEGVFQRMLATEAEIEDAFLTYESGDKLKYECLGKRKRRIEISGDAQVARSLEQTAMAPDPNPREVSQAAFGVLPII